MIIILNFCLNFLFRPVWLSHRELHKANHLLWIWMVYLQLNPLWRPIIHKNFEVLHRSNVTLNNWVMISFFVCFYVRKTSWMVFALIGFLRFFDAIPINFEGNERKKNPNHFTSKIQWIYSIRFNHSNVIR